MTDTPAPTTPPTDEERAAFKRQELEAAKAIMAGDRYCPDPSVHVATPAEALDEARVARAITAQWPMVKKAGTRGGPTPLDIARALLARLSSPENDR